MAAETCAEKLARLAAYVAARDKIVMGTMTVRVRAGEKEVQYAAGDAKRLDSMIEDLRNDIARNCPGNGRPRGMTHIVPHG